MALLFWGAVALIAYTYVVFPALVLIRGRLVRRPYRRADVTPSVSLIVVAHNEAAAIGAKLDNVLSLDYPRDKLDVLVASDGSTDGTDAIVRGYAGLGVTLLPLPRRGKIPALNAAVAAAAGEILVFSDANSMVAPQSVRALVRPFADPAVGGVAGDQRYLEDGSNYGEQCYWNFDRLMKQSQSAAGSVISATGAIYAIRRCLFRTVPPGVTDDFATSTGVIAQGFRLVFAADAVALEPVATAGGMEFARKVRVITRGLRGVLVRRELLNPLRHGFYAIELFSHKILRRLVVFPLLLLFLTSWLLWSSGPFYRLAAAGQLVFYICGVTGMLLGETRLARWKVFAIPFYFCLVNVASLLATINLMRGRRIELWEPRRRQDCLGPAAARGATTVSREGNTV